MHPTPRRHVATAFAVAVALAASACSSDDTDATPTTPEPAENTAATTTGPEATTSTQPSTTAPPTTVAPTTAPSNTAPATTTPPTTTPPTTAPTTAPATTEAPATTTGEPGDDDDAAEVVRAAADATLAVEQVAIDLDANLQIGAQELGLTSIGRADYVSAIADVEIAVDAAGDQSEVRILSDGTTAWLAASGTQASEFPGGAEWVEGDAQRLAEAESFRQSGLLGIVLTLRGAFDVELLDANQLDGVEVRRYATTIPYEAAVEAAGAQRAELASSLSLTDQAAESDLIIEVAIGPDGVVRQFDLEIDGGALPVGGTYSLTVSQVGEPVDPPDAPDPSTVATGPEAAAVFDALTG